MSLYLIPHFVMMLSFVHVQSPVILKIMTFVRKPHILWWWCFFVHIQSHTYMTLHKCPNIFSTFQHILRTRVPYFCPEVPDLVRKSRLLSGSRAHIVMQTRPQEKYTGFWSLSDVCNFCNWSWKGSPLEYVNGHEYWLTARMAAFKSPILRD